MNERESELERHQHNFLQTIEHWRALTEMLTVERNDLRAEVAELKERKETLEREIAIAVNLLRAERNMHAVVKNELFQRILENALRTELRAVVDDAKVST